MPKEYEPWSFDSLWNKAVVYAARAHKQDREGEEFPFWSLLTLELIGRAVLAHTHPALLADSKSDENIMTAFGFGKTKDPRSIPANLVFRRCAEIVDAFSKTDADKCISLMEFRNREIHTGESIFAGWPTSVWLTDYYRTLKILVTHIGKTLEDLLGAKEAANAEEIVFAAEKQNIADVAKRINIARTYFFDGLSDDERELKRSEAKTNKIAKLTGKIVECPICSSSAALIGNLVSRTEANLDKDELISKLTLQPSTFSCTGCRLSLGSLSDLFAASKTNDALTNDAFASMTNPFTLKERTAIEDYFEGHEEYEEYLGDDELERYMQEREEEEEYEKYMQAQSDSENDKDYGEKERAVAAQNEPQSTLERFLSARGFGTEQKEGS
jgi:hypothetical protein